jgi:CubicO group peptidase (beta-lactamase class C family)
MTTGSEARAAAVLERSSARHAGLVVGLQVEGRTAFWSRGALPDGHASIFEIGSITKTFTAVLLADMAREGLVGLDNPAQSLLPDGVRMPTRGRAITLEDLATHRSGLPRLPKGLLLPALTRDRRDPYARFGAARLEASIAATPPRREPGRRPVYSNYGMGLLGYLLARRAGTSYEELVRSRICEPLGMADTWIETPAADGRRVAVGHTRSGRETPHWNLAALAGAGGLRSTAADLLRFLGLHADRTQSPLAEAACEARRPRASWGRVEIGLAWLIVPRGRRMPWRRLPHDVLMHEGGTGGFRCFAAAVPDTGTAVVVLANQARSAGHLGLQIVSAVIRGSARRAHRPPTGRTRTM